MKFFYIDTSVLVSLMLKQGPYKVLKNQLESADDVISSQLIESELMSVCRREEVDLEIAFEYLNKVSLIIPDRSLRQEITKILKHGYCRGADLFHLSCALYIDPEAKELQFLTSDDKQKTLAKKTGFKV